jgi:hypothetical protein
MYDGDLVYVYRRDPDEDAVQFFRTFPALIELPENPVRALIEDD